MKAIGFHEFGGPDVLRVLELPEPQAGPSEVRIRVHAAAVNPTDILLRTGGHAVRMPDRRPPFVPGIAGFGHSAVEPGRVYGTVRSAAPFGETTTQMVLADPAVQDGADVDHGGAQRLPLRSRVATDPGRRLRAQ